MIFHNEDKILEFAETLFHADKTEVHVFSEVIE